MSSSSHTRDPVDEKNGEFVNVQDIEATTLSTGDKRFPVPSDDPQDPFNWPSWRKNTLLVIVALHGMMTLFGAAMPIPGFADFMADFHISITKTAYIASIPIIFFGVMPLVWSPIAERIGRRTVYLVSALVSAACILGAGFCKSYGTIMTTRVFFGIFAAPALSIGACTVEEMFFAHEKGQKMGVWVLLVVVGPMLGPICTGYLFQNRSWPSAFYLTASCFLALFFAHLFFGPETLYPRGNTAAGAKAEAPPGRFGWSEKYLAFRVINPQPLTWREVVRPLMMATRPILLLSSFAIAIPFAYTAITMIIFSAEFFGQVYHLSPGQISLQLIALLIGAVLGEQAGGPGGDALSNWRTRRAGGVRKPEYRLPLVYPGFVLAIVGLVVWGVELQNATRGHWTVRPDIGGAIALFGGQLVTTVCTTYAIESYPEDTTHVSAFLTVVRQTFSFIAPFYLPDPYENWGYGKGAGLFASLIGVSAFMMVACHVWGPRWRGE